MRRPSERPGDCRLFLCSALLALSGPALSQTFPVISGPGPDKALTIHVGDGTITGKRLKPYQVAWHGTLLPDKGDPIDGGIWIQQMRKMKMDGRDVMVRTAGSILFSHGNFKFLGAAANRSTVDADTFAPISSEQDGPRGDGESWAFTGSHVEHREWSGDPQAKPVVHNFDLPVPAYDVSSTMLPLFMAVLPLRLGYSGAFPVVGDPEHPVRSMPFKVVGREKVRAGARGMIDAWIVDCQDPNSAATLRFWYNEKLPYPVKMDIAALPGIPRTVYELID